MPLSCSPSFTLPCPAPATVVLVGAAFSGLDLAQEIAEAGAAQLVYLCARDWDPSQHGEALAAALAACQAGAGPAGASPPPQQRVVRAPNVAQLHADGGVTLEGGHHIAAADAVIYCTGYVYSFPFLDGTGIVSVDDNRVGPLYMVRLVPCWASAGLCYELQAAACTAVLLKLACLYARSAGSLPSRTPGPLALLHWPALHVGAVPSGRAASALGGSRAQRRRGAAPLPGKPRMPVPKQALLLRSSQPLGDQPACYCNVSSPMQEMKSQAAAHYAALDEAGVPLRHTHRQPGEAQARYNAAVAAAAGDPTPPAWRYDLYAATWRARAEHGERYRGLPLPGEEAAVALAAAAAEAAAVCAALQQPSGG